MVSPELLEQNKIKIPPLLNKLKTWLCYIQVTVKTLLYKTMLLCITHLFEGYFLNIYVNSLANLRTNLLTNEICTFD